MKVSNNNKLNASKIKKNINPPVSNIEYKKTKILLKLRP